MLAVDKAGFGDAGSSKGDVSDVANDAAAHGLWHLGDTSLL